MNKNDPIFQKLIALNLPAEDYAVFGSGPMFAHGIKDLGHDIDLIARGKAWDMACTLAEPVKVRIGPSHVVTLHEGEIEIFNNWAPGDWDINALIDDAEVIEGVKFVLLKDVIAWKGLMGRDKDKQHVEMIKEYLANTSEK